MKDFIPLLVLLMIVAALIREDRVLTVFYLIGIVYLLGRWWSNRAFAALAVKRVYPNRAFLDDVVPICLKLSNRSWLPVLWVSAHESLPNELSAPNFYRGVAALKPHGNVELNYSVRALKRGYYKLGPLFLRSGDFLGLWNDSEREGPSEPLIIYPKIIPLTRVGLPSRSPYGTIRHNQPVFEDPNRVVGKRPYQPGDSMRHIDWKATAVSGLLQVKQFEASISLETAIFLNLGADEYDIRSRFDASELAIVVAASIANWVSEKGQAIGLVTNGLDPLENNQPARPVPARKGRGALMRSLDILARVQVGDAPRLASVLRDETRRLSWGTTLVVITPPTDPEIIDELIDARRRGLNALLIQAGPDPGLGIFRDKARSVSIPFFPVLDLDDLDAWRC